MLAFVTFKRLVAAMLIAGVCLTAAPAFSEPRGIRNLNPGNIEKNAIRWKGQVACSDARFVCFDSPVNGIRAMAIVLYSYHHVHGIVHLEDVIDRWSPPRENDTEALQAALSSLLGTAYTIGPENIHRLVKALIRIENGIQPYTDETIQRGIRNALSSRNHHPSREWFAWRPHEDMGNEASKSADDARNVDGQAQDQSEDSEERKGIREREVPVDSKGYSSFSDSFSNRSAEGSSDVWTDGLPYRLRMDRMAGRLPVLYRGERRYEVGGTGGNSNHPVRYPFGICYSGAILWREPDRTWE